MTHYEIDDVKWRVARLLGESFGLYSEDEIAELEAALRTDDPEALQLAPAKAVAAVVSPAQAIHRCGTFG